MHWQAGARAADDVGMKTTSWFRMTPLLLLLGCGGPDEAFDVTQSDVQGAGTVQARYRVLHWNIAGGKIHNCRTGNIKRAVMELVRERDVDFVGLNEICPQQYEEIRLALKNHWGKNARFSAWVRGGRVGNAIFSRFALDEITKMKLGEDRYGDRNLLCGRVRNRPHLRFCSTHLSPNGKAPGQLDRAFNRVERWWENRRDTVIVAGDFNIRPNEPAFNSVYAFDVDTRNNRNNHGRYHELDDDDPQHCRGYGERTVPNTTGGPCGEGGKIDMIFVRRNRIVDNKYFANSLDIPQDCGGACSDHRAVIGSALLRIKK